MVQFLWIVSAVLTFTFSVSAKNQKVLIEFRTVDEKLSAPFKWYRKDRSEKKLANNPFLKNSDFKDIIFKKSKNPNFPDKYEIEITYSEKGISAFKEWANIDREQHYCLVIDRLIYKCSALPPEQKKLYLIGTGRFYLGKVQTKILKEKIKDELNVYNID